VAAWAAWISKSGAQLQAETNEPREKFRGFSLFTLRKTWILLIL
jgi:hypothetical protein